MKTGELGKTGLLAHTTIISVLVKADKHANDFQMFFSILQKRCKTREENRGQLGLENTKQPLNMQAQNHNWLNLIHTL